MATPKVIRDLVARYRENEESYRRDYGETETRREFLDPFFKALGWDIDNTSGHAEAYKDVVHEDSIKIGSTTKAPDYSFRIGGARKFFLEAKKPAVDIQQDSDPAFQLRRYAWSAKLPLSIVSNFAELAVYDCRIKPAHSDKSSVARVMYFTFTDYIARWDEIAAIFSKEAILRGSFDKYATAKGKRGTAEVDDAFLEEIESWRDGLARNIAVRNSGLAPAELNYAVQQTIDRIVFLRICEDRGIELYGRLMQLQNGENTYSRLKELYRDADDRYNSGLFHFRAEKGRGDPDALTLGLKIDDKPLKDILRHLYYPDSPYEFSVLPADILGQVYEQFLGKVIRLTAGGHAKVEEKPDVKKAGGVYYTPTHIVDFIVKNTLGKILVGCSPEAAAKLRVVDPACGSGSFLIGAYQFLLDWQLRWYTENSPEKYAKGRNPKIYQGSGGVWRLTTAERKRVLLKNIYGVDVDPQAVEVTKLSLLLKVLEDESAETIGRNLEMFRERALPDLDENIKCGNSLIGPDFFSGRFNFGDDESARINAFDWTVEFPSILAGGGFDAVIGNPPYVDSEWMSSAHPGEREYCSQRYLAASGNWDMFCVFIEKAVNLTRSNGYTSFILPNKLASANYAEGARRVLTSGNHLVSIRDYSAVPVFPVAVYPIVFVSKKTTAKGRHTVLFEKMHVADTGVVEMSQQSMLQNKDYFSSPERGWPIFGSAGGAKLVGDLRKRCRNLGDVATVVGAATVGEAYLIGPLLKDRRKSRDLKFVNSGTTDRYAFRWGQEDCRYLKNSYRYPRIALGDLEEISAKRARQAQEPKLVISGMTKVLECGVDLKGEYVAGKSTTVVFSSIDLLYLAALLNSKMMNYLYDAMFGGDKLAGGYLRVGPPQISTLPILELNSSNHDDRNTLKKMRALAERAVRLNDEIAESSVPQKRTQLVRQISATEREIDQLVYKVYSLSDAEIKLIEESAQT